MIGAVYRGNCDSRAWLAARFLYSKLESVDVRSEEDRTYRIEFIDFSRNPILQSSNNNQIDEVKQIVAVTDGSSAQARAVNAVIGDDDDDSGD